MDVIEITEDNREVILDLFDKGVDSEGYIIEQRTGNRLMCPYSKQEIKVDSFSILPGSCTFINNSPYCFTEHMVDHNLY